MGFFFGMFFVSTYYILTLKLNIMKTQKNESNKKLETPNSKLQKSSVIFMQLGLVFAMLVAYLTLEHKSFVHMAKNYEHNPFIEIETPTIDKINIIKPKIYVAKAKPQVKKVVQPEVKILDEVKPVENKPEVIENPIIEQPKIENPEPVSPLTTDKPVDSKPKPKVEGPVHPSVLQEMPTYPGCEGLDRVAKFKCLNKKVNKHIQKHFNTSLAQDLGLKEGSKRISIEFIIDEQGDIASVRANAPHPKLKKEAQRIINKLPKMKPGKQHNKTVKVKYNVPINFNIAY